MGSLVIAFLVTGLALLVPPADIASSLNIKSSPAEADAESASPTPGSAVNPIYDHAIPDTVDCPLPELDPYSHQSWEPFLEQLGGCLHALWEPTLADVTGDPEPLVLRLDEGSGPDANEAGDDGWHTLASYQDGEITIMHESITTMADAMANPGEEAIWVALVAHEYAHYLQDHTGILAHAWEQEQAAESDDDATAIRRRGELQADCLGGVALHALGYQDEATVDTVTASLLGGGDSPTHGSSNNRRRWLLLGWHGDELANCNTYAAETEFVR